jgi:hypothetical protein
METFDEKIKKSFGKIEPPAEFDPSVVEYIIEKIIGIAIQYDRGAGIDFEDQAKKLTNSIIEKANASKI